MSTEGIDQPAVLTPLAVAQSFNADVSDGAKLISYQKDTLLANKIGNSVSLQLQNRTSNRCGGSSRWIIRLAGLFAIASIVALVKTPLSPDRGTHALSDDNDQQQEDVHRRFYPFYADVVDVLHQLDSQIEGTIYMFDQRGFESAALVWNQLANRNFPFAVIQVQNEHDVQQVLPVLRQLYEQYGIPFRVRSGGHHKAGYSSVEDGIVISLVRMNSIELDTTTSISTVVTATFGPAVLVQDVLTKVLLPFGYAGVIGICGTVAESGFILGGGHGFQSRLRGLGLDLVVGMRVVLADGTIRDVDANHDRDLFWALRGAGGGNFGVVTQLRYRLHPATDTQLMTKVLVSIQDLPYVLQRIGELNYNQQFPSELCVLSGEKILDANRNLGVFVNFMWFALDRTHDDNDLNMIANNFHATMHYIFGEIITEPINWTLAPVSWTRTVQYNEARNQYSSWAEPPWIKPYVQAWTGYMFNENNTITVWTDIVSQMSIILQQCSYLSHHIELWGGAISKVASNATAFFHRGAVYNVGVLLHVPSHDNPTSALEVFNEQSSLINAWWPSVSQYFSGVYNNYPMASLSHRDYARAYWGDNLERLVQIKQKYDPTNIFQFEQSVPIQL